MNGSTLTFTGRLGLVPGTVSGTAQSISPHSGGFHEISRVTVVGHSVVEAELAS